MPVLGAEYRPTQAPGANAQAFLNGYDQVSSIMDRKQRLNMLQQQQDMQQAEFQAKLPAIQAAANLQVVNAAAAIKTSAEMDRREAEAAKAWTQPGGYNEDFQNILMGISDPKEQADALQSLQGRVAWTKQFKAYAPGVDAVNNARASAYQLAITNLKLDQHLEETQAAIQGRVDAAMVAADAKKANALTYSGSRERIAAINQDTKLSVEDKKAAKTGIQLEDLQRRATEADQAAADAQATGDTHLAEAHRSAAASYRDAIQRTTTFAGTTPSAPRDKTSDPRPTPPTAQSFPPLTFGGKSLATPEQAAAVADKIGSDWTEVTLPSGAKIRVRRKQ